MCLRPTASHARFLLQRWLACCLRPQLLHLSAQARQACCRALAPHSTPVLAG